MFNDVDYATLEKKHFGDFRGPVSVASFHGDPILQLNGCFTIADLESLVERSREMRRELDLLMKDQFITLRQNGFGPVITLKSDCPMPREDQ